MKHQKQTDESKHQKNSQKKTYQRPELVKHGNVETLTEQPVPGPSGPISN